MTPQEQQAFDAMREALEQITPELRGLGLFSDIALSHAGIASSALAAAKAVSELPQAQGGRVQRNDPLSALSIRILVANGAVSQSDADAAFTLACEALEEEARKMNATMPWVRAKPQAQGDAAIKTLVGMGYTYHGAEQWKPPLGKPPRFLNEVHQQARKPLTPQQRKERCEKHSWIHGSQFEEAYNLGISDAEAEHGIKE